MTTLVIGAAISGRSALALLRRLGSPVRVYDADPAALTDLAGDAELHGGAWDPGLLSGVETVVVSPGVPEHAPPISDAVGRGIAVWSEIELAARHLDVPLAAVTGTNGKTTVTALTARMLRASGIRAEAVGNIGNPLCDAVGLDCDALVVEASSFQLRFIDHFHPRAAVLLNVAPDHLDWHGTFEAYLAAKARIWERQTADDVVVYDADDAGAVAAVAGAPSRRIPVSGNRRRPGGIGPVDGVMDVAGAPLRAGDLARSDPTFLVDVAAAAATALVMGADPPGVIAGALGFVPEPHRRQVVGSWDAVTWVDDSKATNPHAALAAIRSYPSVVLIAGGRNKDLDVAVLGAEPNVRFVVGVGEAGPDVVAGARSGTMAADMDDAVAIAARRARPGDTVLLAPGCASFDMYRSYAERGERFAEAVRRQKEGT